MCLLAGDAEFRQRRTMAAIVELAREIAELDEALRGIAELEPESRRLGFLMRRLRLWMKRRLKHRKKILLGGMAVSFVWSATIVCLVATGRAEIAFGWLSLFVVLWMALGIARCAQLNLVFVRVRASSNFEGR